MMCPTVPPKERHFLGQPAAFLHLGGVSTVLQADTIITLTSNPAYVNVPFMVLSFHPLRPLLESLVGHIIIGARRLLALNQHHAIGNPNRRKLTFAAGSRRWLGAGP